MNKLPPAPPAKFPSPLVRDLGLMEYRAAWNQQLAWHEQVVSGRWPAGVLLLLEHPPVITIGRTPGAARHLLASPEVLAARGVPVVPTDRGGDITFHGPGQLVAYPLVPLNYYQMGLHDYMRFLEQTVIQALATFGLIGWAQRGATGVWVGARSKISGTAPEAAKICALGVRLRRGVSLHGLALNVTTDLSYFDLINPCGLNRPVTSLAAALGGAGPDMQRVKAALVRSFLVRLGAQSA